MLMPHVLVSLDVCMKIVDKLLHACRQCDRWYSFGICMVHTFIEDARIPAIKGNSGVENFTVKKHLVRKVMSVAPLLTRLVNRKKNCFLKM